MITANATHVIFSDGSTQTSGNVATGATNLTGGTGTIFDMVITTLGVNWQVNTGIYSSSYGPTNLSTCNDIFMKSDGTRLYVLDSGANKVNQYNLSTPFNVITATYASNASIGDTVARGVSFKTDGTRMYVVGQTNDRVLEYNLGTAWVVNSTSVSYVSNVSISTQDGTSTGLAFSSDGTKMYISGDSTDKIYEYALGTAWSVNTASYTSNVSISTVETSVDAVAFKDDGTKMYVYGSSSNKIHEYALSSAWSINSSSYSSNLSTSAEITGPTGLTFSGNGHVIYASSTGTVYSYNCSTGYRIKTLSVVNNSFSSNSTHIIIG